MATASTGALASDVKTDDPKAAIDCAAPGATFALKLFKNVAPKSHNTAIVAGENCTPIGARLAIDRPFVPAVRDDATGDLLYIGQVADPSKLRGVPSKRRR